MVLSKPHSRLSCKGSSWVCNTYRYSLDPHTVSCPKALRGWNPTDGKQGTKSKTIVRFAPFLVHVSPWLRHCCLVSAKFVGWNGRYMTQSKSHPTFLNNMLFSSLCYLNHDIFSFINIFGSFQACQEIYFFKCSTNRLENFWNSFSISDICFKTIFWKQDSAWLRRHYTICIL